jgi:hypothetical protein
VQRGQCVEGVSAARPVFLWQFDLPAEGVAPHDVKQMVSLNCRYLEYLLH